MPLKLSPEIEARVERLFVLANMPLIKRPIPVKQVHQALEKAAAKDPALVQAISRYLERYDQTANITHFSISGQLNEGTDTVSTNNRGFDQQADYQVSYAAFWTPNDFIAFNSGWMVGNRAPGQRDEYLEGSFLSLGWDALQADIGYRPHWWGPFRESDMLLSSNAATPLGITFSNVTPFSFLGTSYEVFLAQLSESDLIESQNIPNTRVSGHPLLFGVHLGFSPVDGMAIGFNRLLQFGGGDRDKGLDDLFGALTDASANDNIGGGRNRDFGNQQSSITASYTFSEPLPIAVYMEYAGEDTSRGSNFRLGNTSLMFGIHLPKLTQNLDFSWEYAEWQNAWYTNSNYGDGLTNYQAVLGHWGANFRGAEDRGASAQTAKLIWDIRSGTSLEVKWQQLENTEIGSNNFDTVNLYRAELSQAFGGFIAALSLNSGNDINGESFNNIGLSLRW
jgi:hypothetical protein